MDGRQCLIVDLEKRGDKRMFITEQVSHISENSNGTLTVKFSTSPRVFNYNRARLLYMKKPECIDLGEKGLYVRNKRISNVAELLLFSNGRHTFYRVTYSNGYYEYLDGSEVYVTRTPIDRNGGSTWDYLLKLAAETSLLTDDEDSILSKQYDLVDLKRDNVPLAQYLGDKTNLAIYGKPKHIYYPFGCNASQKKAVEAALTHQVSVIQGPPGTGKTQTILNIIVNLLINGKTVLVVSNNNSAVDNVAEKLYGEGLGFLLAKLGSVENRRNFISNQTDYPFLDDWVVDNLSSMKNLADTSLTNVSKGFDAQVKQASLKAEYAALTNEAKYYENQRAYAANIGWLESKPSGKLMELLNLYKIVAENGQSPNLWFKIKWAFSLGFNAFTLLGDDSSNVIASLESAYYFARRSEIKHQLEDSESVLQSIDMPRNLRDLRSSSMQVLKSKIAKRYMSKQRSEFTVSNIKYKSEDFLKEYPVVLSTSYSAKNCISKDMVFDYVIMDEASQADIKTGALVLSCANNAVIVGDDKQLPNVVSSEETLAINAIVSTYRVADAYNAATHSFLQSCNKIFIDAPVTLLREHYRCHPKIIEFCNRRFYNNELVAMTDGNEGDAALQIVRTVKGNHARGHFNQREIDVIVKEIIPNLNSTGSVGIITPYRVQAEEINKALDMEIASTVHKYQGRECDTIIMSTVDNTPTEFSDDANLLNVAISRAKTHLCIVTNGNDMPRDSILGQLIAYIEYNNFEIKESKLNSVFDLLYSQYTHERLEYENRHNQVSEYLSENLVYDLMSKAIKGMRLSNVSVLCHYPLSKLIGDWTVLDEEERSFAESPFSHVDFLVYNSLTKQPIQTIEVDGWRYHKNSEVQQHRDAIKDRLLTKFGLRPNRILTTDTVNEETIKTILQKAV